MKWTIYFVVSLFFIGFTACHKNSSHPAQKVADSAAIINLLRTALMKHGWSQDSTTWMEGGSPWKEVFGGTGHFINLNIYQDSLLHYAHDITTEYNYSILSDSSMIWVSDTTATAIHYKILSVTDTQLKMQWKTVIIGLDSTTIYTDYYHAK